jgi:hypothetical protein
MVAGAPVRVPGLRLLLALAVASVAAWWSSVWEWPLPISLGRAGGWVIWVWRVWGWTGRAWRLEWEWEWEWEWEGEGDWLTWGRRLWEGPSGCERTWPGWISVWRGLLRPLLVSVARCLGWLETNDPEA